MSREKSDLLRISDQFAIDGKAENVESHGNGHINDTYLLTCRLETEFLKFFRRSTVLWKLGIVSCRLSAGYSSSSF